MVHGREVLQEGFDAETLDSSCRHRPPAFLERHPIRPLSLSLFSLLPDFRIASTARGGALTSALSHWFRQGLPEGRARSKSWTKQPAFVGVDRTRTPACANSSRCPSRCVLYFETMAEDGLNNALGRLKLRGRGRSALRRTGTDVAQARSNPSPSSSSTAVNVAVAPEPTSAPSLREVSGNQLVVRSPRLGRFSQLGPKASDDEKIEQIIDTREVSENTKVVERYREKTVLMWYCLDCDTPCLQIREESRW